MPDMTDKVVIVTGGSAGLGKLTVKALLERNATVYLAARDEKKSQNVIDEYTRLTGKVAIFLKMDLADLNSVRAAVEEFLSKENKLHVLYNNGGVMMPPTEKLTSQGYDLQFGTNVLGHFYLTKLLLHTLLCTAEHTPEKIRVVNISSSAHYFLRRKFDLASLKEGHVRRKWSTTDLYSQSKLGNILFANELARRYGEKGIVSTSINPGNLKTDLNRHIRSCSFKSMALALLQIYDANLGVLTQLWAGTSPEGANLSGKFLVPWCREGIPRPTADDPSLAKDLWKWMEEQVQKFEMSKLQCSPEIPGTTS